MTAYLVLAFVAGVLFCVAGVIAAVAFIDHRWKITSRPDAFTEPIPRRAITKETKA